jgi:hypothetical protein
MSSKNRSLLEAFKATGTEASLPPTGGSSSTPARRPAGGSGGATVSGARLQMIVLAQLILLVVAFLLGRASVDRVSAAEGAGDPDETLQAGLGSELPNDGEGAQGLGQPSAPQPPAANDSGSGASTAAQVDPRPQTDAERALLDPANQLTIKLVEYANTSNNLPLAQETLRYVTGVQQMPACLAGNGSRLYVLIGAASTNAGLASLLERARKMNGPPPLSKPGEFHDAYVEKIDKVFKRK